MWRFGAVCIFASLLAFTVGCSKKSSPDNVVVEIPAGFTGNFVLDMGVRDAAPLARQGSAYVVAVPPGGKAQTSTLLHHPQVTFRNSSDGQVWGFSERMFTTGDGISTGGKIEFFVGTQKDYDAEQQKNNKSDETFNSELNVAAL